MSGTDVALILGAMAGLITAILGGVAAIQSPIRKRLDKMDTDRTTDNQAIEKREEENAQVHRTIVCGQLAVIKALRQVNPSINGKVADFERKYEHMLEYDCPPPKPAQ